MKKNLRRGKFLLDEGYDLKEIAKNFVTSSHSAVFHPVKNQPVFLHNELDKNPIINYSNNISYRTESLTFFLIIHPSVFDYWTITIGTAQVIPKDNKIYSKEKHNELSFIRRAITSAKRRNRVEIKEFYKQGEANREKIYHVDGLENSGKLVYFYNNKGLNYDSSVKIYFTYRAGIEQNKKYEDHLLKFQICDTDRMVDFSGMEKEKLTFDFIQTYCHEKKGILDDIHEKSDEISTKIVFREIEVLESKESKCLVEAQDDHFTNGYMLDKEMLWMRKKHECFKCYSHLFSENITSYNVHSRYIAHNAFEYYKDGEKLNFCDDYFIFDFELYSNLYHYFDKKDAEECFIKNLMEYRYDMDLLEKIIKGEFSNKHSEIIHYLVEFYDQYPKHVEITEEIRKAIKIYKSKLHGKSNMDAWRECYDEDPNENAKSYASKKLKLLSSYAEDNKIPYIDPKALICKPTTSKDYMTKEDANSKLLSKIEICKESKNKENIRIIDMLDASFLK